MPFPWRWAPTAPHSAVQALWVTRFRCYLSVMRNRLKRTSTRTGKTSFLRARSRTAHVCPSCPRGGFISWVSAVMESSGLVADPHTPWARSHPPAFSDHLCSMNANACTLPMQSGNFCPVSCNAGLEPEGEGGLWCHDGVFELTVYSGHRPGFVVGVGVAPTVAAAVFCRLCVGFLVCC